MTHQAASKGCSQLAGINLLEGSWRPFEDAEAYWMFVQLGNGAVGRWPTVYRGLIVNIS